MCHDDKQFESKILDLILSKINNVEVKIFPTIKDIISDKDIQDTDLIILSLRFEDKKIEEFHSYLQEINYKTGAPYLLFSNTKEVNSEKILFIDSYPDLILDFVEETEFSEFVFINRVRVLLNIPALEKSLNLEKRLIIEGLWSFINYSTMFAVMITKDLEIKLVNYHLAKTLGYNNEEEPIGDNWTKFLKIEDYDLIKHISSEIIDGNGSYKEFSNDIIDKDKNLITVKWFNVLINHGFNCVFSIGIPLTKEPTINEDIDSIRAYFKDILEKDKTIIKAMKEVTMKRSKEILEEITNNTNNGSCSTKKEITNG